MSPRWLALVALCTACGPERGTIGAVLAQRPNGELEVREVPEKLGADKSGLREGDQILLIDGMDVRGLSSEAVHRALSGEVGEPVKLTVVRGEEVLRITVRRTPAQKRRPLPPR